MLRYKNPWIAWLTIFTFLFSLVAGTGILSSKPALAWHDPEHGDIGHDPSTPEPPDNTSEPEEKCPVRSPVYLRTGSYSYSHQDLFIPGRGVSLDITRDYDSQDFYDGPFGYGWKFNLEVKLIETTDGSSEYVTIRRGDGVRLVFTRNPDGTYTPPLGRRDHLTKNADGTYIWCEYG